MPPPSTPPSPRCSIAICWLSQFQEKLPEGGALRAAVSRSPTVMFTRQLATMVDAGLAMVQSLQGWLSRPKQSDARYSKTFAPGSKVAIASRSALQTSEGFQPSLHRHGRGGRKKAVCWRKSARLAVYLENTARLRKKVKSAMMYPTVVTFVAIAITIFLLIKVIPVFGDIYSGFGAKLPGPTSS